MRYESHTPQNNRQEPTAPELDVAGYLPSRKPAAAPRAIPAPATANPASALAAALDRLEAVIEAETTALEDETTIDFADMNRQKSQSLLEISRLSRALTPGAADALRPRLDTLRARLFTNHRLLGFHLSAAREVSDLMVGILSEAESDGTYSQGQVRREKRP